MKKDTEIKVTLKFHPNKAIGARYEIARIDGAVIVEMDNPENTNFKKTFRVSDYIDEHVAVALGDVRKIVTLRE